MPSKPGGPGRGGWIGAALLLAVVGLVLWLGRGSAVAGVAAGPTGSAVSDASKPEGNGLFVARSPQAEAHRERLAQATARVAQAQQTLASYRESTRYPYDSRPIDEQRDQTYPTKPVEESQPLTTEDGKVDPTVRIKTSQSRVFVASGERVVYTVAATDTDGHPLALTVTQAVARGITAQGSSLGTPQAMPLFNDSGTDGDTAAGDGTYSATLAPADSAFAQFNGTIRLEVRLKVGEHEGGHRFDIVYTPELPAVWAGPIHEAQEAGSLALYLPATVRVPGRYVINGRLDDASGKPLALLTFNEELPAGAQQIRLLAFGKLIRDLKPAFPLRLRDVDGYLLKENTFPDRALMPRLTGLAYTTRSYALASFSDAEWSSEERDRYLAEYGKDVNQAQQDLDQVKREPGAG